MRAFVADGAGAGLREWPDPVAAPGEILVQPLLVGMCGTDLELIDATIDPAYVSYPLVLGHEWVGRLADSPGSLVAVEGIVPCGVCAECVRGATNRCEIYDEIGFTRSGALAGAIAVPTGLVHPLAEGVALDDAVLVEPMAVVWRALTRLPYPEAMSVAVVGDGTIGLLVAYLVRRLRPERVTVIGPRASQAGLAEAAGADDFLQVAPERRFDLVVEAAGVPEAVSTALALVGRGGTAVLLGLPPHGSRVAVAPDDLVNNDVTVQGSFSYTRSAFAEVVDAVNARELRPSFLVTHRYDLDDVELAVAQLRGPASPTEPRGKVVVDPRDPS